MAFSQSDILQGTLDPLILKAIGVSELHDFGVSRRIEQITESTFQAGPGSLYPAHHTMKEAGSMTLFRGESENRRRAKCYRLTKAGHRHLTVEVEQWNTVASATAAALKAV